jgi:hypothetical protein
MATAVWSEWSPFKPGYIETEDGSGPTILFSFRQQSYIFMDIFSEIFCNVKMTKHLYMQEYIFFLPVKDILTRLKLLDHILLNILPLSCSISVTVNRSQIWLDTSKKVFILTFRYFIRICLDPVRTLISIDLTCCLYYFNLKI